MFALSPLYLCTSAFNQCRLSDEKSCVLDNTAHLVLIDDEMFIPLITSKDMDPMNELKFINIAS